MQETKKEEQENKTLRKDCKFYIRRSREWGCWILKDQMCQYKKCKFFKGGRKN